MWRTAGGLTRTAGSRGCSQIGHVVPVISIQRTSRPQRPHGRFDLACRRHVRAAREEPADSVAEPAEASSSGSADAASTSGGASSALGSVDVLKAAQPVDRLRYQGLLLFERFDVDQDGELSPYELQAFFTYASRKLMWSPGLSEILQGVQNGALAGLAGGACSKERFLQVVRDQVHAVSCSTEYQRNDMRPDAAARLQAQMGLAQQEICAAKWIFTLLDYDADGKVQLSDLERATGIESYYYEAQLQDADGDDDGAILFEEFLLSYAKPRPVWKNLIIMASNTLAIFLLLQSPLDVMLKCILCGALILRPQIISRPVCMIYDGFAALVGASRARAAVAQQGDGGATAGRPSVWRAA